MEETTEINNVDTHNIIGMIMDGVGNGLFESGQATKAVKFMMSIDSKAENFIASPKNPKIQEFIAVANARAKDFDSEVIELIGFSVAKKDGSPASRRAIDAIALLFAELPEELRFNGLKRAGHALLARDST